MKISITVPTIKEIGYRFGTTNTYLYGQGYGRPQSFEKGIYALRWASFTLIDYDFKAAHRAKHAARAALFATTLTAMIPVFGAYFVGTGIGKVAEAIGEYASDMLDAAGVVRQGIINTLKGHLREVFH